MELVTQVRLCEGSPDALLDIMQRFNAACNWLSQIAFNEKLFYWLSLQRRAYHEIRQHFCLPSTAAVVAIRKVAYAYSDKSHRDRLAQFSPQGAIPLYRHSYKRDATVAFYGLRIPFTCYRDIALSGKHEATLIYRQGRFFIHQVVEVSEGDIYEPQGFLGCDLGIVNILTDSDGEVYSGQAMEDRRRAFSHRRRNLQRKGTRASRRKLREITGKQSRFQRDTNHCIAKKVVAKAQRHCLGIALEDLQGIRDRITARRRQRARLANWGFHQLRAFIDYKARLWGVPLVLIDAKNTSRECPTCGFTAKGNRVSQAEFICGNCGHAGAADHIAALNIRARACGDRPMVAASVSDKSSHLLPASRG